MDGRLGAQSRLLPGVLAGAEPDADDDGGLGRGHRAQLQAHGGQARLGHPFGVLRGRARPSGVDRQGGGTPLRRPDPLRGPGPRGKGAQGAAGGADVRSLRDPPAVDRGVAAARLRGLHHRLA